MAEEDFCKFDLSKFDEKKLKQHQIKVLICFGSLFGLRGNDEHTNLMTNQITEAYYKPTHPLFPNLKYCGLKDFQDKTHQLSLNKPFVRKEIELGRFPVISDGISGNVAQDIGGTIGRLLCKIPIGKGSGQFYLRIRRDGNGFCDSPLGKSKIRDMMRDAFKILEISNWKTLHPHALRGHFITTLANDKSVSLTETMAAARHTSVSASAAYQSKNCINESNRVQALLGVVVDDNNSKADMNSISSEDMVISADKQPEPSVQGDDEVNERFSTLTQIEVNNLERELTEMEIAPPPERHDSLPRFCVGSNAFGSGRRGRFINSAIIGVTPLPIIKVTVLLLLTVLFTSTNVLVKATQLYLILAGVTHNHSHHHNVSWKLDPSEEDFL